MKLNLVYPFIGFLIITLIVVVIFLVKCENKPVQKTVLEKFIDDMQPISEEFLKLNKELLTSIYNENKNLINAIYSSTSVRNNFKNVIGDTQCIIEAIKVDISNVSTIAPINPLKCIDKNVKNIETWEKGLIFSLTVNIILTLRKLVPGSSSVVED